ncbi:hypothetical protein GCM10027048_26430 [Hymenobacter coalescens]
MVAARADALAYYSPYFFLRLPEPAAAAEQERFGRGAAARFGQAAGEEVWDFAPEYGPGQWLLNHLSWDSDYFGTPTYRLFTGLFGPGARPAALSAAASALRQQLAARGSFYAFSIVPAEDLALLQALTGAGWQLVETRLTYYHDAVADFGQPRHPVRLARPDEAERVGAVSAAARNDFDRYHADPWFGPERADAYLARYAAAAVTGFADAVLVPDEPGLPLDSFLAIGDLQADAAVLGAGMSRVLLTAVGPANRGWHVKLVGETVHRARTQGHRYVLMTTQATNRAVFRTSEKLGFKLGATSHVLACYA